MRRIHIVTDSMCHIPPALCQELQIHVIPLPYVWDDIPYLDNDIGPREFYTRLRQSNSLPKTSGPTPGAFIEKFESIGKDGQPILAIHVGQVFSSTFSASNLARDMASTKSAITTFNSDSNSMGLGFQVLAAARAAKDGKGLDEILQILNNVKARCGVIFSVFDFEYLLRGGRISHLTKFIATALNMALILEIRGGPIKSVERVRSKKNVIPRLLHHASERIGNERPIRIAVLHADNESYAWELAKQIRTRFLPDELIISELSPVLAVHTGPDAVGLAYSCSV